MTAEHDPGFFRRRVQGLQRRWHAIAGAEYDEDVAALRPGLPEEDCPRVLEKMRQCLDARGGVLGAMETMYQRGKIQEESMLYERKKHSGELPVVGVNTFLSSNGQADEESGPVALMRSGEGEKERQLANVREFQTDHSEESTLALERLQRVAQGDEIDHVLVLVQRPFHLDRDSVVVAVQGLANVAIVRDEMRSAEDVVLFIQTDAIGFRHGTHYWSSSIC